MLAKRQRLADRPEIILDAAAAVLREGGARALTIDAVAAAAKLSKGGVLHHYASKDALILALVTREMRRLREGIEASEATLPDGPGQLARAMFAHAQETYADDDEFSRALLLAAIDSPEALSEYRSFLDERLKVLDAMDGGSGDGALLIFSILGLVMGRALGFHSLNPAQAAPIFESLNRIARKIGSD